MILRPILHSSFLTPDLQAKCLPHKHEPALYLTVGIPFRIPRPMRAWHPEPGGGSVLCR